MWVCRDVRQWSTHQERGLRTNQTCWPLDLGPSTSGTVRHKVFIVYTTQPVVFCYGSLSRLTYPLLLFWNQDAKLRSKVPLVFTTDKDSQASDAEEGRIHIPSSPVTWADWLQRPPLDDSGHLWFPCRVQISGWWLLWVRGLRGVPEILRRAPLPSSRFLGRCWERVTPK